MARSSLQAELEQYLEITEEKARQKLSKVYQQEVILHCNEWVDSMFLSWVEQDPIAIGPKESKVDRRTKRGKELKQAFHEGGKVAVNVLYEKLNKKTYNTGGPYGRMLGQGTKWQVEKFDGVFHAQTGSTSNFQGVVVYLLDVKVLDFEDPTFKTSLNAAKKAGIKKTNELLKLQGKRTLNSKKAESDLWGHHGGTNRGVDPKSTYGLVGITRGAAAHEHVEEADFRLEFEPGSNKLDSYSDLFWKRLGNEIKVKGWWEAKQHASRPTARSPKLTDTHVIRIVLGHGSLKPVVQGFDKAGKSAHWTKLEPTLANILDNIRTDVEADVIKQAKAEGIKGKVDLSGSDTPRTKMRKLAAETVVKNLSNNSKKAVKKRKNQRVTTKSEKLTKSGTKQQKIKRERKGKGQASTGSRKGARDPVRTKKSNKGRRSGNRNVSPVGLIALLNKSLPREVMNNMGPYPRRLENRTGRFAHSAEVVNVAPMPNSVEIQYTYQKDPYAVFEPENGNAMASWGRDPKRIIGGTIREIAQSIMGDKFGLVRTKRV